MVKLPEKTPDWKSIAAKGLQTIFKYSETDIIQNLIDKTDRFYYFWDKVRAQPLPNEFTKDE
ncbi:MAG: hypothetical protein ACK5MA_07250, partial [Parachlamydiaceae bacterium]